jgi:hypothetical protein
MRPRTPLRGRTRLLAVALLTMLATVFGQLAVASANDVHESNFTGGSFDYIKDAGQSTEHSIGEGFTTSSTYAGEKVHHISVYLQRVGTAENACVWLTLRSQFDTGDMGNVCVNAANVSTGGGWVDFVFSSAITITPGATYFFITRYYGSCDTCMKMFWSSSNTYRGTDWPTVKYGQDGGSCCWYVAGTDVMFQIGVDHTPVIVTKLPQNVVGDGARLVGGDDDDAGFGSSSQIYFKWGTTMAYGNTSSPFNCPGGWECWQDIAGLPNGTTYHYMACGKNDQFTQEQCGIDQSFTTLSPAISVSPPSVSFGTIGVGTPSSPATITVTNTGGTNTYLGVSSVSFSGTNSSDFAKQSDGCTAGSVPTGSSCTFQVKFTPAAAGSRSATVTINSNAGSRTVSLSGTGGVPGVSVSPPSISYGTVAIGTSSSPTIVTVTSNGTSGLSVTGVAIGGTNAAEFSKSSDTCTGTTVPTGSTCTFRVTFSPTTGGAKSGTATVSTNAGTQVVTLSGVGGIPAMSVTPTTVSYGSILAGTTSAPTTVTVSSNGAANLAISSVSIGGTNAADFTKSADTCAGATLVPGTTCTFNVTFAPGTGGPKAAAVTVTSNAGPQTVALSGTATAPAITVSPSTVDFGIVTVASSSGPSTVTVTNTGTAPLSVTGLSLTGVNAGDYALGTDTCSGASVAPNASCTFQATFTPSAGGTRTASVTIASNAGSHAVPLTGFGGVPQITVSPGSVDFGYVGDMPSDPRQITVSNTGTAPLSVTSAIVGGANASEYVVGADTCTGATVAAGSACTFELTFTPSADGTRVASVTVASNAGSRTVSLTGTGDLAAPTSAIATPNNGILLATQSVTGSVTDGRSGVDTVVVTFTPVLPLAPTTVNATLSCNATRRLCTWSAAVPLIPGLYSVNVRATDLAGNVEFPGPTVSIIDV